MHLARRARVRRIQTLRAFRRAISWLGGSGGGGGFERINQPTHPPHQPSNPNNQPTLFWLSRGVVFLCGSFPTFSQRLVDFGTSGTPHGTILGPFSELKFQKMPSGAQNGPRLAPGRCFPNVTRHLGRIFGSPWAFPNLPQIG